MAAPVDEHAPELPAVLVERVLAYRAAEGDVVTLCAAACVARTWRAAAAQPTLWLRLVLDGIGLCKRTTAERLSALVARSAPQGADPPDLQVVNVRHCALSPEDVVRALRGRRVTEALSLGGLQLAGYTEANSKAVLESLRTAVTTPQALDVHTTCSIGVLVDPGGMCYNLCSDTELYCRTCNLWACTFCANVVKRRVCEHECSCCRKAYDDEEVAPCDADHHRFDHERFCERCRNDCSVCERHLCLTCDEAYACCTECEAIYCHECHDPKDDGDDGEFYCERCEELQTESDRRKEAEERDAWEEDGPYGY